MKKQNHFRDIWYNTTREGGHKRRLRLAKCHVKSCVLLKANIAVKAQAHKIMKMHARDKPVFLRIVLDKAAPATSAATGYAKP